MKHAIKYDKPVLVKTTNSQKLALQKIAKQHNMNLSELFRAIGDGVLLVGAVK